MIVLSQINILLFSHPLVKEDLNVFYHQTPFTGSTINALLMKHMILYEMKLGARVIWSIVIVLFGVWQSCSLRVYKGFF